VAIYRTGTNIYVIQTRYGYSGNYRNEGAFIGWETPIGEYYTPLHVPIPLVQPDAQLFTPEAVQEGPFAQTVALEPAVLRLLAPATTQVMGGVVVSLSPANLRILAPAPTVLVGGVVAALSPAMIRLLAPAPSVVVGGVTAALAPAIVRLLAPVTTVVHEAGGQTVALTPAQVRLLAAAPSVLVGGVIAALTPAVIRFIAPLVTVDHPEPSGPQTVLLDPATLRFLAPSTTVAIVGGEEPPEPPQPPPSGWAEIWLDVPKARKPRRHRPMRARRVSEEEPKEQPKVTRPPRRHRPARPFVRYESVGEPEPATRAVPLEGVTTPPPSRPYQRPAPERLRYPRGWGAAPRSVSDEIADTFARGVLAPLQSLHGVPLESDWSEPLTDRSARLALESEDIEALLALVAGLAVL
jgi:hypothetical protein